MTPNFEAARMIGNNIGGAFKQAKENNAIEQILSDAIDSGDPAALQQSIGKILSQVSPERQGVAVKYLEGAYERAKENKKDALARQAAQETGYTYGAPSAVQAAQVKENAKQKRLASYNLGGNVPSDGQQNPSQPQPLGNVPDTLADGQSSLQQPIPNSQEQNLGSKLQNLSDLQLISLIGAPDREISEPAKAERQRRIEENKLNQKRDESWIKFGQDRAKPVLDKADEIGQTLPIKKTSLELMKNAIVNKNLGFWSYDNIAEITGNEAFRTPEGALFKTAAKEYFLGNISRAGARPNQWIEQQIADMMTKIGRSTAANLSVSRALQNETDLDEERVNFTELAFNKLRKEGKDVGQLGSMVNTHMLEYAKEKQDELFNDLRAIKTIDEGKPQKFHKVKSGTKPSDYMIDALLQTFGNDPEKAYAEARKLGYTL